MVRSLLIAAVVALSGAMPLLAQTGQPKVGTDTGGEVVAIGTGVGIFDVDGTQGRLPDLLPPEELDRLTALLGAPSGPSYKIDSPVSPDDRTILASTKGQRFFVNLQSGEIVPVVFERILALASNVIWLDDDTAGFLTFQSEADGKARLVGGSVDRRTGAVTIPEPRLAAVADRLGEKQTPLLMSDDGSQLLLADGRDAKPMAFPGMPRPGDGKGDSTGDSYDPIPTLVAMALTEGTRLIVTDVATGAAHEVFSMGPDIRILDVAFSADGSRFCLTSESIGDSQRRTFDGANLTEQEYQDSVGILPPGKNIFFQSNQVTVLDTGTGALSTLRAADGDGLVFRGTHWNPDGSVMLAEMAGPGRLAGRPHPQYLGDSRSGGAIVFYDRDLREIGRIDRPEVDSPVKDARFISETEVLVQTRHGTNGHPYLYNLATGEFRNLADRPGAYLEVVATRASREIVFVHTSWTEPPEYGRAKMDGTGFTRLTSLNATAQAEVRATQHAVSFDLEDGDRIDGVLILPEGVAFPPVDVPIVVWQSGGPFNAVTNNWDPTVETPASLLPSFGFGVLVTPLYGRHGYGDARFNKIADNDNFGRADIDAQAEIVDQMRARGWAGKVGIAGCSYGGYFVTQSLVRHSDIYDAGHSMCSIVDWVTEWSRGGGQGAPWLLGKAIYDDPMAYVRVSPVYNASAIKSPLLAFHGTDDFVPIAVMENLMHQVIAAGTPARLLRFRKAGHGLSGTSPAELARGYEVYGVQEQVMWFRTYLGE
ncbi:MAG: prolyl oligopeptidase family serine peptidase [Rhodobacteraceae bacterium]|uniref:alpha/beta hydrolase family protein n=1 Tax=Albidovulum sp. TaxID=1872424 RepID=UPI001DC58006|nr:prolyl oligopeptidase family serine peptidase [uncultured Defluviimonas sp.]MCB2125802.1 prolyl oligopeptidase family serine peptidase [Paracoccaceae bacterium]MCC0068298.1 prolyl oligopeptidase family serine peptidase [Paracoccaceae bacterium]